MAKMIIEFGEFGGIAEFNGVSINYAEPLIINKAADYLTANAWAGIDDEEYINYRLSFVDFDSRNVSLHIEINGVI